MQPPRPAGFVFLTGCALVCACVMAAALALSGTETGAPLAARFALGATGALALVTAEALAFVRPWAFGASLAFAGSFIAMTFVSVHDLDVSLATSAPALLPILVALSIVYNGLDSVSRMAHGPRTRVPRPNARIP